VNELWLRVEKYLEGDQLPGSVYAELSGTGIRGARRFMIPAGWQTEWHREPVEPGQFLVQVRLPSGTVISRDVTVSPETGAPRQVVIRPEPSAHEYLSWPQFLGSVEADLGQSAFSARTQTQHRPAVTPRSWIVAELYAQGAAGAPGATVPLGAGTVVRIDQNLDLPSITYSVFRIEDEESVLLRFFPAPEPAGLANPPALGGRLFLRLHGLSPFPHYVSLPLQWYQTPDLHRASPSVPEPVQVDVLLHQEAPPAPPASVYPTKAVVVRDAIMGPLLGYLKSGDLSAVQAMRDTLLRNAEDVLYYKRYNPYAAVAGALVLLKTRAYERLHDWPRNLAEWFPWLPDGAVIDAWCRLHGVYEHQRRQPDVEQARHDFVESARRGVPIYTDCLRLSIEGLKQCQLIAQANARHDEEVSAALERMRAYASAIDWQQPFTAFTGENPLLVPA